MSNVTPAGAGVSGPTISVGSTLVANGTSGRLLYNNAGTLGEIATSSVPLTINTTPISGGTSGRVLYDNAGTVGELATTGSGSVVRATSPTLTTPIIAAGTWADIPAATTAGVLYYASDFGVAGTLLRANGTRWKPVNGSTRLATLDTISSNIGNTNTVVFQYLIPANAWQLYDRLRLSYTLTKSGTTDTARLYIHIGTAGTTSDAAVQSNTGAISAGSRTISVIAEIRLDSVTSAIAFNPFGGIGSASTSGTASAVVISSAASNALYYSVAISSSSTNDTVALRDAQLELVCTAN